MSKVAHYLQEHVLGEVSVAPDVRRHFSTDGSILTVQPSAVLYPRNENDVRKTARFTWQLAERGRIIPITARGLGTDQTGAALGKGIIMVFPAHMDRILELDSKTGLVTTQPGTVFGKLQQTLHTHGRFLPPYPASLEYSTIGGAVANNAGGEKSVKYGSTRQYVKGLRVVLANGEVIETARLNKREVNRKMGLATLEGEVYRALDKLFEEHQDLLEKSPLNISRNAAGYDIWDVKHKDGSFDLTPLFVGSQGTLGVVTEVSLQTEAFSQRTTLIAAFIDDMHVVEQVLLELRALSDGPSAVELIDGNLLAFIEKHQPNELKDIIEKPLPKAVLLIEFDNTNDRIQKRAAKKAQKILSKYEVHYRTEHEAEQQDELWKIRRSAAILLTQTDAHTRALPLIEDGIVPVEKFQAFVEGVYDIFKKQHLPVAVYGHVGDGNVCVQPKLDLAQTGDRQKAFKLMDEYYKLVLDLGGSITAQHGDGRLRAPYTEQQFGKEICDIFAKVKTIFDPYGTMNPGVKVGVKLDHVKPLVRQEYHNSCLYDFLPYY